MEVEKEINKKLYISILLASLSIAFTIVFTCFYVFNQDILNKGTTSIILACIAVGVNVLSCFLNLFAIWKCLRLKRRLNRLKARRAELEKALKKDLEDEFSRIYPKQ